MIIWMMEKAEEPLNVKKRSPFPRLALNARSSSPSVRKYAHHVVSRLRLLVRLNILQAHSVNLQEMGKRPFQGIPKKRKKSSIENCVVTRSLVDTKTGGHIGSIRIDLGLAPRTRLRGLPSRQLPRP